MLSGRTLHEQFLALLCFSGMNDTVTLQQP